MDKEKFEMKTIKLINFRKYNARTIFIARLIIPI